MKSLHVLLFKCSKPTLSNAFTYSKKAHKIKLVFPSIQEFPSVKPATHVLSDTLSVVLHTHIHSDQYPLDGDTDTYYYKYRIRDSRRFMTMRCQWRSWWMLMMTMMMLTRSFFCPFSFPISCNCVCMWAKTGEEPEHRPQSNSICYACWVELCISMNSYSAQAIIAVKWMMHRHTPMHWLKCRILNTSFCRSALFVHPCSRRSQ